MGKTAKITIVIAGDNKGATTAIGGTQKNLTGLGEAAQGVGKKIAGAFSIAAIAGFGKKAFSDASEYAKQVATIRRLTGDSAENSSALVVGAQRAGVDFQKLSTSAAIFATNIKNGKVAAEGIATKDANGNLLSFDEILRNTADHLKDLPPGYQRAAAARAVFGRGGADMVKMLQEGSKALDENAKAAKDAGLSLTQADLKSWADFRNELRELQRQFKGLEVALAKDVLPLLTDLTKAINSSHILALARAADMLHGLSKSYQQVKGAIGDTVGKITEDEIPALRIVERAINDATVALDKQNKALPPNEEHWRRTSKAVHDATAAAKLFGEKTAAEDALRGMADAQQELADAQQAAVGNSDEYQAAVKQQQDDEKQLAGDLAAVSQAQVDAADAQAELNKARDEAKRKVEDLKRAVVEQRMAERDATLSLHEAQQEYRRANANPGATELDKERAVAGLADAQDKLKLTQQDRARAEADAAKATVANDEGVIAAHKRVEDATKAIGTAEEAVKNQRAVVAADGVAKQKILEDAARKVADAERNVQDATLKAADALRILVTDQKGPLAGWQAYLDVLNGIKGASPEVVALIAAVNQAVQGGQPPASGGGGSGGSGGRGPSFDPSSNYDPTGGAPKPRKRGNLRGGSGDVNVTVNVHGVGSHEQGRAIGNYVGGVIRRGR